ncbi:16S rRNA (cytosine(967)-C(5))-methyltransferase RsmB [Weissella diestrammenae]|uniref:16S rRNA (cytosine(967)-C(5))-methyltransferase n=1 Tax=Weissella diestrammenae TaxID=1162633 RepID=A0A7G9T506_9LACO|nr:16S rRNA (cytosine(967)-C(5))-methyltransferase RsmB [Weissella diestrammenae]MCM0582903.1 16S rRNA (cytosine(967)-C(5))-methyltransferase RsmB [Weissella diestrammenae]QNN75181.1 16S rRNA (cytosine(967)-C(5))-methyltransferase RsmB [Weissella diestrammenae]
MSKGNNTKIATWEMTNARAMAIRALEKVRQGAYSNLQLNQVIQTAKLDERDVHLLTTLVYGVIQHRLTLEYWLAPFVRGKIDPWVKELLMSAVFQMEYLDKVPTHAIFDEAIQIAKRRGHDGVRKFVTGVLHAIERQGLADLNEIEDPIERLSIQASLPIWLINQLQLELGMEKTVSITEKINQAPAQSARVNLALTTPELATEQLKKEGFEVTPSQVSPDALRLNHAHVASSQAFINGLVTLQDESAMLMVPNLGLTPNSVVLDAAAAPGGKTTQIATYLSAELGGRVDALDIHDHKVQLIMQNAERLKVADRVFAQKLDARQVSTKFVDNVFDAILVDAPCSGFGLLRRKPEIRYEKTYADSQKLHQIQVDILNAVAPTLKVGGMLVYGTCTILKSENEDVIDEFLAQHPDFEICETKTAFDLKGIDARGMLHIFPDDYDSDGFFIATLRKNQ